MTENLNTILLVDDEQDIRDVLQVTLADAGYDVLPAANGCEALEVFQQSQPAIVVTDIKMPVMDGIELLRRLKRENPETEVIMITGHGDMDLAIKSLKHEAADFITKPINVDALEIAIRRTRDKILTRAKLQEYTASLEELIREKIMLQDHLSSLGLMIGTISHGIKGLLTGLDGGMYLLRKGLDVRDSERIEEGWDTVSMMVERIRKMVMDILFYAKKRDLNWEKIDAAQFAKEAAKVMESKLKGIKDVSIALKCRYCEGVQTCEIDPGYVLAALMNLFDNAVEACQSKGPDKSHEISFDVHADDGNIIFEISDTGIGMDTETQSRLFTVFFSSKGRKGTGLGLYMAESIIKQHGGAITVKSSPGKGSCFSIKLPKKE
jgi:signal transduction histidine kinase